MSPATRNLVLALLERAAEVWAAGNEASAERWASSAFELVGDLEFVDTDEATR